MLDTEHVKHKPSSVCLNLLWLPNCVITWSLIALVRLASTVLTLHDSHKPSVVCLWDSNCHCNLQIVFMNKNKIKYIYKNIHTHTHDQNLGTKMHCLATDLFLLSIKQKNKQTNKQKKDIYNIFLMVVLILIIFVISVFFMVVNEITVL